MALGVTTCQTDILRIAVAVVRILNDFSHFCKQV